MKAKIISIGDELLRGEIVDTNSQFLSAELYAMGIDTALHIACPDEENAIVHHLREEGEEMIVLVAGGLGPTEDDVTREAFAKAMEVELERSEEAIESITKYLSALGRQYKSTDFRQHMLPKGALMITNLFGTAPGFSFKKSQRLYYCMPGVPLELRNMFSRYVSVDIRDRFKNLPRMGKATFKMYGIAESVLADACSKIHRPAFVKLGFYPRQPEVHLCVFYPESESAIRREAETYLARIKDRFKDFIFAQGEQCIEEKLVDALIKNKLTLSVAESCTGGLISSTLVNVPGSSGCFERGVITYSNSSKEELLSVSKKTLLEKGAVSQECALEMARGIRKASKSDLGVATTGVAGPGGGTDSKPVGTTFIAISTKNDDIVERFEFKRNRNLNRTLAMYEIFTRVLKLIDKANY